MSNNGASANRGPGGSRRFPEPAELARATAFSANLEVGNSTWLFEHVRTSALLGEPFLDSMRINGSRGPKRERVEWILLYLDFATSDSVDVQPWYADAEDSLFRAAGCSRRPCLRTVRDRFVELEQLTADLEAAAARLIQNARHFEPRIGMYVHVDSTEAETHAALVHACPITDPNCQVWKKRRESVARRRTREARWGNPPADPNADNAPDVDTREATDPSDEDEQPVEEIFDERRPLRIATSEVRADRHRQTSLPAEPTEANGEPSDPLDLGFEEVGETATGKLIRIGGCLYRTLDPKAGIRAYTGSKGAVKFWHGYYNMKAIDHVTRAPIAVRVDSASKNEHMIYPELLDQATRNLGTSPRAVIADRGFSVRPVFELNTRRGIASVIQWRRAQAHEQKNDNDRYDRHGIPRCQHCGATTEFVRFHHEPTPRIWFRCMSGMTDACNGVQSIACATDWRALVPLRRDDPVYLELRRTHQLYEAVHDYWRDRYKVAAADIGQRPKRIGPEWQQLRANAALLVEWLRISYLHGWLGGERTPCRAVAKIGRGNDAARRLRQFRAQIGLNRPYGSAAVAAYGTRCLRRSPSETWAVQMRWDKRKAQEEKAARATRRRSA